MDSKYFQKCSEFVFAIGKYISVSGKADSRVHFLLDAVYRAQIRTSRGNTLIQ